MDPFVDGLHDLWVAPDPLKFIDGPFHLWMALSKEHHRASMELPHNLWMAPTQLMGGPRRTYWWTLWSKFQGKMTSFMWVFLYFAFFPLCYSTFVNCFTVILTTSGFVATQDTCQWLMTASHHMVHSSTELKLHSIVVNELLRDTGIQESCPWFVTAV